MCKSIHHGTSLLPATPNKATRRPSQLCEKLYQKNIIINLFLGSRFSFDSILRTFQLSLQHLGADEFGPTADLGGNALGTGQLGVHGLREEKSSLIKG